MSFDQSKVDPYFSAPQVNKYDNAVIAGRKNSLKPNVDKSLVLPMILNTNVSQISPKKSSIMLQRNKNIIIDNYSKSINGAMLMQGKSGLSF